MLPPGYYRSSRSARYRASARPKWSIGAIRPTEAGKAAIRKDDRDFGGINVCFARREIESTENFTEPADLAGIQLSRVSYRYRLADIARWTDNAEIKAALPTIGRALAQHKAEATDTLMLTNKGWQHQHALRK